MIAGLRRLFRRPPPEPHWIDIVELRQQLDGQAAMLVVDVRGPDEFAGPLGHIDGALNIPLPELANRQTEISASGRPVVCVCLTDKRSAAAAAQLAAAGLSDIAVLRGGMKAWREAWL
jgi:rhodanese-related sulfurtransferase